MLRNYIESLIRNKVPQNSGYNYVTTEKIAIPMHKVTLGISKRQSTDLELVEEMVLRFVSIGISDLDTITAILGLPRDILDITVGDLHVKNLAFHSSGKCILLAKGRSALKTLAVSKREKDSIRFIYVNAVTGEMSGEKDSTYTEAYIQNDQKLKHRVDANCIELYRRNMSEIAEIFNQNLKTYLDDGMKVQDELVSIDSVEDFSTGFIIVPIHIYVSDSGLDIDIIAYNRSQKTLVDEHREIVIEEMRKRRVLSHLAHSAHREWNVEACKPLYTCLEYGDLQSLILNKTIEPQDFENQAGELILCPRRLFDNELLDFCELVFKRASLIEIQLNDLKYWAKSPILLTIGSYVSATTQCSIYYKSPSADATKSIQNINRSCPNISTKSINQADHSAYLRIIIDSRIQVDVFCEWINILSKYSYTPRLNSYVSEHNFPQATLE